MFKIIILELLNQKKKRAMYNLVLDFFSMCIYKVEFNEFFVKVLILGLRFIAQWFSFFTIPIMFWLVYLNTLFVEQLVIPRETQATTSSTLQGYNAYRTVDGNFDQDISRCSHTNDLPNIKEAWLRINLEKVYSIKSVKFWYSKYDMCINMCA